MPGLVLIQGKAEESEGFAERFEAMLQAISHFDDYTVRGRPLSVSFGHAGCVAPTIRGCKDSHWAAPDGSLTVWVDGDISNASDLSSEAGCAGVKNDAELVSHLYRNGPQGAFLKRLRGWHNILIDDRRGRRLLLANDRYGIRPLYVAGDDQMMVACGEIKGVLAGLGAVPELDERSIADWFAFDGVLNDATLFKDIQRMPPGACWVFESGSWRRNTYSRIQDEVPDMRLSEAEVADAADVCFQRVLPRHLEGDYCLSLTGGNDTRLMASMLEGMDRPDFCFTYGLNDHTADIRIARTVAEKLGLDHHSVVLGRDFLEDFSRYAEDAVWLSDGQCDVMSSTILRVHEQHRNRAVAGGKYGTQIARGVRQRVWDLAGLPYLDVLSADLRNVVSGVPAESLAAARSQFDAIENSSDRDLLFTIIKECRHHWGGKIALENALVSVRTPFLDPEVVALTLGMPDDLTNNAAIQHELIRRHSSALAEIPTNRGLLPKPTDLRSRVIAKLYGLWFRGSVVCNARRVPPWMRMDKTFFANNATSKFRTWFREDLAGFVREILLDPRTLGRSYFDPSRVRECVELHTGRKVDCSFQISKLLTFELFLRQFIDGDRLKLK